MMQGGTAQEKPASPVKPVGNAIEDPLHDGCSTPEEQESLNRIKAPPVCVDLSLKQESMSTEILQHWIFPEHTIFPVNEGFSPLSSAPILKSKTTMSDAHLFTMPTSSVSSSAHVPVSVISVSSNTSSGDSYNLSSDEISESKSNSDTLYTTAFNQQPRLSRNASERLNAKILLRKTSRQGRSSQRWVSASSVSKINAMDTSLESPAPINEANNTVTTPSFDPVIRLVTGCVPILQSGKILFVSASRKPAWILPKGGWELDESMEESAIRECYEEAGCIGTLGPALSSIQYETRKAKKRRIENEFLIEKESKSPQPSTSCADVWQNMANPKTEVSSVVNIAKNDTDTISHFDETDPTATVLTEEHSQGLGLKDATINFSPPAQDVLTSETMTRIRQLAQSYGVGGHQTDTESMSAGSTLSAVYTHVQMTLFPLYVQKIESDWPENGRFRKAVDIDEAIKMMDYRPELQSALIEVRDRKLHLISITQTDTDS
jgi:ADP-ribose pyrophosphatase YjhB (NUDIX family)